MPNDNRTCTEPACPEQSRMGSIQPTAPHLVTSHDVQLDADYTRWLVELKARYRQAQIKAASRINEELLRYYWQLGADIDARGDENRYGTGFYKMLSRDLQQLMPEAEGFSESNLKFAVRFYRMYSVAMPDNREQAVPELSQNQQQAVADLQPSDTQNNINREQVVPESAIDDAIFKTPWGHHILILKKVKGDRQKALFYVHKTLENQWSRAMLLNMMGDKDGNNGLYVVRPLRGPQGPKVRLVSNVEPHQPKVA